MEIDKKVEVVVTTVEKGLEAEKEFGKRSEDFDAESQVSTVKSVGTVEFTSTRKLRWWQFGNSGPIARLQHGLRSKKIQDPRIAKDKRRRCCKWLLIAIVVLSIFGAIASIIYITFVRMLISRLAPPIPSSGLTKIVESWKQPDQNGAYKFAWPSDFSQDITPKSCHSHNDYWRSVPLYAALAAGCSSVEADVWLTSDHDLRVGHIWSSTTPYRTLRNLYLDPLANILENRNVSTASANEREVGVFETDPNVSVVLLIDIKTDGHAIWPVLQDQLRAFREKNWLTYYDGTTQTMHHGPLTIVGTGQTPFELIQRNTTERWIFYDAPLMAVSNAQFDDTNSYYASTKFSAAVSTLWLGKFSAKQEALVKGQIEAASLKGLKSRYYGTPAWPIGLRDRVWAKLMELGVGVLNVDDLVSAARWNWDFCVVAGFVLCGDT